LGKIAPKSAVIVEGGRILASPLVDVEICVVVGAGLTAFKIEFMPLVNCVWRAVILAFRV
jgi:hypothetical protein